MIKYVQYDSMDDYGRHIIPVNSLYQLNKTAAGEYSQQLMKVILNMKKRPDRYYVVINALGSDEVWGSNRNGDGFPESGLAHKSLRTDMGSLEDYGFKTFEYYAKLFKHHMNKTHHPSFGEVIYSHWNPVIKRVELIVAIDVLTGKDIIEALEKGLNVSVSMGCKVKYDRCSICDNKAPTRAKYCIHLKNHMNEIISEETAKRWSRELNRVILPGTKVYAINDRPRFFDISKVHIGADRTSYVLGKAASEHAILSTDIAEVYGVTDEMIDKISQVGKVGEINKKIGGPGGIDGTMTKADPIVAVKKKIDDKMEKSIAAEPVIPNESLDAMSKIPLKQIFSTMLGMGVVPKPEEVQRIIIVKIGRPDVANDLDRNGFIFNHRDDSCPMDIDISNNHFNDSVGKLLTPHLKERSCFPSFLEERLGGEEIDKYLDKNAAYSSTQGKDYWIDFAGRPVKERTMPAGLVPALGGLAALYSGLKLKSLGYTSQNLAQIFVNKPWLRTLIGGGLVWSIANKMNQMGPQREFNIPASAYENALQNTNFSGHLSKSAEMKKLAEMIILPGAYISNAVKQASGCREGRSIFPEVGQGIQKMASSTIGDNTILTSGLINEIGAKVSKLLSSTC